MSTAKQRHRRRRRGTTLQSRQLKRWQQRAGDRLRMLWPEPKPEPYEFRLSSYPVPRCSRPVFLGRFSLL